MANANNHIIFPGDWVKVAGKWNQVWETLNNGESNKVKFRNGVEWFIGSLEEVLSNDEFFEQKEFLIVD